MKAELWAGVPVYLFEGWRDLPGVRHAIFSRAGGVSQGSYASLNLGATVGDDPAAVAENRERVYRALGTRLDRVATVWQVHGRDVQVAIEPSIGRELRQADVILTDRPGLTLMMRFADCTPILLVDPVRRAVGIAHAGWRGTVAGAAQAAVEGMARTFGSRPEDIRAGIGPAIGPCCYAVGSEVAELARQRLGESVLIPVDSQIHLDLWRANENQLREAGVGSVEVAGTCTSCHRARFFSHRGDRGQTGRFGAAIQVVEER